MVFMTARWLVRLPEELANEIDARAGETGLSRNTWMVKALTWLLKSGPKSNVIGQRSEAPGESASAKPSGERKEPTPAARTALRTTQPDHEHVWIGRVGDQHCKRCGAGR